MCLAIFETRALKGAGNISGPNESGKANKSHGISKGTERRANTSMNGIENTIAITANQVDGEISAIAPFGELNFWGDTTERFESCGVREEI
jgi:hypothetical protein